MQRTRRGISADIMQCDGFIDMPATAQALYVQLLLTCDDEGFTASLSKCKFFAHATDEDIETLEKRRFIYLFENDGVKVVLIKHWGMCNYMKSAAKSEFTEREKVYVKDNGNYTLDPDEGKPLCAVTPSGRGRAMRPAVAPVPTQLNTTQYNSIKECKRESSKQRTREGSVFDEQDGDQPF